MSDMGQEQLALDLGGPPQFKRREPGLLRMEGLYFAVLPEPDTAIRAIRLARMLHDQHRLPGKLYRPELLHISLNGVGAFSQLPEDIVFAAMQAAAAIELPPFTVAFDRIMSFGGKDNRAQVLACSAGAAELKVLYRELGSAMCNVGLAPNLRPGFTPHMTLVRDRGAISEIVLDHPITWTINEFVLVHSLLGRSEHRHLGRWPLLG